jgi:hypothetical protein
MNELNFMNKKNSPSEKKPYSQPRLVERRILIDTQSNSQPGIDHRGTGSDQSYHS